VTKTGHAFNSQSQILFVDDQTGWILSDKQILKTTDGGTTWVVLNQNLPDLHKIVKLWFTDRRHGWAAGELNYQAAIWETSDEGASWTLQYSWAPPKTSTAGVMMDIRFADSLHGWAVGGNQATAIIVATVDGGQHWTPQYSGGEIIGQFDLVRVWDSLHVWVMGSDAVMQTDTGGVLWSLGYFGDGSLHDMELVGPSEVWITASSGSLLHNTDGVSWPQTTLLNRGKEPFLGFVKFTSKNVGWVTGLRDEIVMTRDGGKTWKRDQGPVVTTAKSGVGVGAMAATSARLFAVADVGQLWVRSLK
jgi:photosystem II stability/assembly factor-like uncharacterized protein